MGKTISEWMMYFEQLSPAFLTEVISALETLQKAEIIQDECQWTGLFTLLRTAKIVKQQRLESWSNELEAKYGFTGKDYEQLEEEVSK